MQQDIEQRLYMANIIVGGDSFSDSSYIQKIGNDWIPIDWNAWPEILAQRTSHNFINTSIQATGNDKIKNSVIDNIIDLNYRVDCVVIMWSECFRLNVFDDHSINDRKIKRYKERENKTAREEFILDLYTNTLLSAEKRQTVLNYNLRCIWMLNNFCASNHLPIYNFAINDIFQHKEINSDDYILDLEYIQQNKYFKLIDEMPRFYKWPFTKHLAGHNVTDKWLNKKLLIGNGDDHPNEHGQEKIANEIQRILQKDSILD